MTNRLSKWSRHSSKMICLLAACGLMHACKDEYLLDDEKPSWLNESIYQSLESSGNFNTYLRLLADKDVNTGDRSLTDVLNRTGSKTVFVANDNAWNAFFQRNAKLPESNPWHYATSYEKLSEAQKRLLIHTSMLNNAIVMENLASSQASGSNSPSRGEYMRRYTDVESFDTITYVAPENLPVSYSPVDKDYWERFRAENGGKGIYMVTDSTVSMMLHFTSEHLTKNTVNDKDFEYFMGTPRVTSDVHIYDAKLISKDGVCQNGYVNITEKPLIPLSSMAEVIRTNGKTDIFSHMLDRYSAPFYCKRITELYKDLHPGFTDSIFNKRYFSDNSYGHRKLDAEPGPNGTYVKYMPYKDDTSKDIIPSLKFDPGWNGYYDEVAVEKDMAAMFVPSDDALWKYFTEGGGMQLITTYYTKEGTVDEIPYVRPSNFDELFRQIDYIPLGTLQSLINIIMLRSFVGSVPSKMTKQRDDAQEQLFYAEDIDKIDTCLLASNGAVYVMNDVYGPADYTSVTSPAYISTTNNIMKWAIYDQDVMGLNYYAYLKAMQSEFTFFLPSDEGLKYYYDPTSMKSRTPRVIEMIYKNQSFPIQSKCYNYYCPYNKTKGEVGTIGPALQGSVATINNSDVTNRLKDILESHTIVHDGTNPIFGEDEYFLSKNGNAIKVTRGEVFDEQKQEYRPTIVEVKGGFQLENERQEVASETSGVKSCTVTKPFDGLKNGQTYVLNAPLVPTYRSVYSILTNDILENDYNPAGFNSITDKEERAAAIEAAWAENPYSAFYDLCNSDSSEVLIVSCGLIDEKLTSNQRNAAMKKYRIFTSDNGLDDNIQFFNNYRYTIFVPTNDAIAQAIANGLPTWESIKDDWRAHRKPEVDPETGEIKMDDDGVIQYTDSLQTHEDSLRIQAKITYLTNFIRYHFADNSVFADKSVLPDNEMVTSSYDKEIGLFCKIYVDRVKEGDETVLRVCDAPTHETNPNNKMATVGEKNVLARDISCNKSPRGVAMTGVTLDASSAAVIHQIDGVLNHKAPNADGRYDEWSTVSAAKKYMKRFAIVQ